MVQGYSGEQNQTHNTFAEFMDGRKQRIASKQTQVVQSPEAGAGHFQSLQWHLTR